MNKTTIFQAKKVITMNPARPEGSAVAVRNGKILAVGTVDELKGWGDYELDQTFADKILMPGLIEAHCHIMEGLVWMYPYVGYFDRFGPDGKCWKGCKSFDELIATLKTIEAGMTQPDTPLIAWGLDPIYFEGDRLQAEHLDQVSKTRPIFIIHASFHLATVNTALMQKEGITKETQTEGVVKDDHGEPLGELQEISAMSLASECLKEFFGGMNSENAWLNMGIQAKNVGCTTIAELGTASPANQQIIDNLKKITDEETYPIRVVSAYMAPEGAPGLDIDNGDDGETIDTLKIVKDAEKQSSDKLRFGIVKVLLDGSIQGYTARLKEPGYYNGKPNGLWISPPENMNETLSKYHSAGLTVYCHCNGNEAVDVFLDAVEYAQSKSYWPDHRHTVQHCQTTTTAQYQRMANLGVCANIFSNHIYYWGDQHYSLTMGPEGAERMEACATAKKLGVHFTLHSDAAVTPLSQLHTAWCAVNRVTASGRVLGEYEKLSVYDALYAVTLDAAYQLKMDHEIGSIEPGKWADFAVLEKDPFNVDPMELKDIKVWGTVLAGKPFKSAY